MKRNMRFILVAICCLLAAVLSGCATIKEVGKGFAGVSTQVLEDKRKDALKQSFALGYESCYNKVKDILGRGANRPCIYAEDSKKKMIAIYLSSTDTTPVGIFFTEEAGGKTLIEISSPSIYAKEEIANRIFNGLASNKPQGDGLASNSQSHSQSHSQSQEEKKTDVKEKVGNQ